MTNGGIIGSLAQFSPSTSGRWTINDVREYLLTAPPLSVQSASSISTLYCWLDASDVASVNLSSGLVSSWSDLSGNGYSATQSDTAKQPTSGSSTINGKNVLSFTGSQVLSWSGIPGGNQTVFAVIQTNDTTNTKYYIGQNDTGTSPIEALGFQGYYQAVRSGALYTGTSISNRPLTVEGPFSSSPTLVTYSIGSKGTVLRINGTTVFTTPPGQLPASSIPSAIGARNTGGSNGWSGSIAEIIVYSSQISSIEAVESYLSKKWGTP